MHDPLLLNPGGARLHAPNEKWSLSTKPEPAAQTQGWGGGGGGAAPAESNQMCRRLRHLEAPGHPSPRGAKPNVGQHVGQVLFLSLRSVLTAEMGLFHGPSVVGIQNADQPVSNGKSQREDRLSSHLLYRKPTYAVSNSSFQKIF